MGVEVIVLNGGSSSGKSSLATSLQQQLDRAWLTLGIDDLIRALSHGPGDTRAGGSIEFAPDGSLAPSDTFRGVEASWYEGLAAIARAGTGVIIDDVFLNGRESQDRLERALEGLAVFWVGVRCRPEVAEAREFRRADRIRGMARDQAERVHEGVRYDMVVDTTDIPAAECAKTIVVRLGDRAGDGSADHS
jgi:chloramphenicol 3-O phosphotransferase